MCYWYIHQQNGNIISTHVTVANGVKQRRVIFAILFNNDMNKLSIALDSSCFWGVRTCFSGSLVSC